MNYFFLLYYKQSSTSLLLTYCIISCWHTISSCCIISIQFYHFIFVVQFFTVVWCYFPATHLAVTFVSDTQRLSAAHLSSCCVISSYHVMSFFYITFASYTFFFELSIFSRCIISSTFIISGCYIMSSCFSCLYTPQFFSAESSSFCCTFLPATPYHPHVSLLFTSPIFLYCTVFFFGIISIFTSYYNISSFYTT